MKEDAKLEIVQDLGCWNAVKTTNQNIVIRIVFVCQAYYPGLK